MGICHDGLRRRGKRGWRRSCFDEEDFSDFQTSVPAPEEEQEEEESTFADFANVVVPPPPEQGVAWNTQPMTDGDKNLIKDIMKGIEIQPPLWAQRVSDKDLESRVKKMLKEVR